LIEATRDSYRRIRVPGKYKYDPDKGEMSLEEHNARIKFEFERKLAGFTTR
jgi:hypothetical protein